MRTFALIAVVSAVTWLLAGLITVMTMDSGPDWLHGTCFVVLWVAGALFVVSVFLLIFGALGVSVDFRWGG